MDDGQSSERQFKITKRLMERMLTIPFNSDNVAKLIFDSKLTTLIYREVGVLRALKERGGDLDG